MRQHYTSTYRRIYIFDFFSRISQKFPSKTEYTFSGGGLEKVMPARSFWGGPCHSYICEICWGHLRLLWNLWAILGNSFYTFFSWGGENGRKGKLVSEGSRFRWEAAMFLFNLVV